MSHCHFIFAGKEWCTHICSFITVKQVSEERDYPGITPSDIESEAFIEKAASQQKEGVVNVVTSTSK